MTQLPIPHKLYSREQEIDTLLSLFEQASNGSATLLLIPGTSGMGKTTLVQHLQTPILARNSFFLSGKFDQYQHNIPYAAFLQALTELCHGLISWDTPQRNRIKTKLRQKLGGLGQVLTDLIPSFAQLIGKQPSLININPQEAKHRFIEVFRHLLNAVCQPEHPLVIFIDDWQWADMASLDLLKQMWMGEPLRYLLVIAAYRNTDMDAYHPLNTTIEFLHRQSLDIVVLPLNNLGCKPVQEILRDTFKPQINNQGALAKIIHQKTNGNPFFVRAYLSYLFENKLIYQKNGRWLWDEQHIIYHHLPDNAVEMFAIQLRKLDYKQQTLISLAACLGNSFDLTALSMISGQSLRNCRKILLSPAVKNLFLPSVANVFTFQHDCYQQASRALIEEHELPLVQYKIGRLLLDNLTPTQLAERVFQVANNLNTGQAYIQNLDEKISIMRLNIQAGNKAYQTTAYQTALLYYRKAMQFFNTLPEQFPIEQSEYIIHFFENLANCEFLEGDKQLAEYYLHSALFYATGALEKAQIYNSLIVQYTLSGQYHEAITTGNKALNLLGISLHTEDLVRACKTEIQQIHELLRQRSISSLVELPQMNDPNMLMACKLLITMGPPCYRANQALWSVIVPKVVGLTLQHGNIAQIGYSHTALAGLLCWLDDDFSSAKQFADVAMFLMGSKFMDPSAQTVFYLLHGSSVRHWFSHLKYASLDYQTAVEIGLRSGNMQYTAYALGHDMYCHFYQGQNIAELIKQSEQSLFFSQTRLNQWAIDLLSGGLHIFRQLAGEQSEILWSEQNYLLQLQTHQNTQASCIYKILKSFYLLILGQYQDALHASDQAESLIYTVGTQGLLPWPEHVFCRVLIITAQYLNSNRQQQNLWRNELNGAMNKLRIWSTQCPDNFEHKYLLAAAELAKIDGRTLVAIELYNLAIKAAQTGNFVQWQAVIYERAALFWANLSNQRLAHIYWQQAYVAYGSWGAIAKIQLMEGSFRNYLSQQLEKIEENHSEITRTLIEQQVDQLHQHANQIKLTTLQAQAAIQAEELAHALQRLRTEIAERKRIEQYELFRSQILEMIANNKPLTNILEAIVQGMEKQLPNILCSILMADKEGNVLDKAVAPSFPDFFTRAITGIKIAPKIGCCGEAAYSGKLVIAENIQTHPNWLAFKQLAAQAGLSSCWSQPIVTIPGKILGTFSIYTKHVATPNAEEIYFIEQCARLAGIAIERKRIADEIESLAFYDTLTGLANRKLLQDRLLQALLSSSRSGRWGALLFIDLDNFKVLNDTLGHDTGDYLLQQVARRITYCVRECDTVARLGGDEFVVLLESLSEQYLAAALHSEKIANKILQTLNAPYQLNIHEHHNTPSIGITLFDGGDSSVEELLKQADMAMYQAKNSGRNALRFFNPEMQTGLTLRVALERELRIALETQQFQLHFQPQYNHLGQAIAAEALIRWQHPKRGLVPPAEFIPIAEESGLIIRIGHWVLEQVCKQLQIWQKSLFTSHLSIAVNVSAKQFRQNDFVEQLRNMMLHFNIRPDRLKLELTESVLLESIENTIATMNALNAIGVQISLDDFGTGYSSLQYLKKLPLTQLKIDRSFIRDIVTDSNDRAIVHTIIAMAQSLNLNALAEGVETEEQRDFLIEKGCLNYQGYLFSRPLPTLEFEQLMAQQ